MKKHKRPRFSRKGLLGLACVVVGVILVGNSILDLVEDWYG